MSEKTIISVGIDIGTSTTQIVFVRLTLVNMAAAFAVPHIDFGDKELLYQSPIHFTPLQGVSMLDGAALRQIVEDEYKLAGFKPVAVTTGAVIITGEAARKENAAIVLSSLSGLAGEFVVATAGPDLEAVLAGKGSGARQASQKNDINTVNLDIGGGTTNLVLFAGGKTMAKGCLDIGGRLVQVKEHGICYISASAARIAQAAGLDISPGMRADPALLKKLCVAMAGLLEQALGLAPPTSLLRQIQSPSSSLFQPGVPIDAICFSGGVADCLDPTRADYFRYGDIGPLLGEAIAQSRLCTAFKRLLPEQTIRATVVGAGSYSTTISGSTISLQEGVLPLKNLPVLKLDADEQRQCYDGQAKYLRDKAHWFLRQNDSRQLVLALEGEPNPSYARLKAMAKCLFDSLDNLLPPNAPLLLALESDTGKALGQMLRALADEKRAVICIDAVHIEPGDYVDLGQPLLNGLVIPVVVKTLAFG